MKILEWIQQKAYKRMMRLYGFEKGQHPAWRCAGGCGAVVTWPMIHSGNGCAKCGSIKVRPSNFSFIEELRLVFAPWSFKVKDNNAEIPQIKKMRYDDGK